MEPLDLGQFVAQLTISRKFASAFIELGFRRSFTMLCSCGLIDASQALSNLAASFDEG